MLTEKQIKEIKGHLERAQNPLFFFDNDQDGLCSFLILQRWLGRGKGVAIKSFPELNETYFRKVEELNADYVFILDKPIVGDGFLDKIRQKNLPVIWIDHHEIGFEIPKDVFYFNPLLNNNPSNEPVTALCYQITNRKEDLWLAIVGCISDGFFPDYFGEFKKEYPELVADTENPFQLLYESRIGEVARILSAGLKDSVTNVVRMLKFLMNAKGPYDILEEDSKNYQMHKRFKEINKKYSMILNKAKNYVSDSKLLFFGYSGDLSVSGELANELMFNFPDKFIIVAYTRGGRVNLSLRGKDIKDKFLKSLEGFEGATGGGHNDAVGGQMQEKDLDEFKRRLEKLI